MKYLFSYLYLVHNLPQCNGSTTKGVNQGPRTVGAEFPILGSAKAWDRDVLNQHPWRSPTHVDCLIGLFYEDVSKRNRAQDVMLLCYLQNWYYIIVLSCHFIICNQGSNQLGLALSLHHLYFQASKQEGSDYLKYQLLYYNY